MTQDDTAQHEERRLVTVLFADLVGYTPASESRDPELIFDALNLTFDRLSEEIHRYGGYVDKIVGDEIMALFGAPKAQEDDAGKAVAAALAMLRALEEITPQLEDRLGQGFSIRIGINTGLVVTGAVGPGGYTVTGDSVNVAARLEKASQPGGITVGEATRRLARRPFDWGERQEIVVKGRTEPVACHVVNGLIASPLRLVPAPSDTPFVGRTEHIDQIRDMWAAATKGQPQVLELVGESGIGKTRMLAHLFATIDPVPKRVLYTRTDTPPRTFGPLMTLLPSMREDLPPGFEERIEELSQAHEMAIPPEVEPDWLVKGMADVIKGLAKDGPVAFVLDDMHRADAATMQIVEKLLPRLASLPVFTLLLRQPTGRRLKHVSPDASITLEVLKDEAARELVASVAPSLDDEATSEVVARAGGNPLYLEMLATAMAGATPDSAIPLSLQTAVVARIDELDEPSRRVLREASVFGQTFYEEPFKLTTTVSDGLYETLAQLCEIGLLDELPDTKNRGYLFRHSLVQEVLYEGLLLRQRVELHRRAAEALELAHEEGLDVEPEQLAVHYREAGESERAAAYHLAAADRADHLRAPAEARIHRRAAHQLLNMASLSGLYATHGRPSLIARSMAAALQAGLATLLVLPLFLIFALRRPEPNLLTLGLPFEIVDFNLSSVMIAVVLGGLPLLVAGIAFTHVAVPVLMRRSTSLLTLIGVALGGWMLALLSVLVAFGALIGLLRLDALDRLSSMYVGGTTLRILLGDYSMVQTTLIGTFLVAVVWTVLLRYQTRGWGRIRLSSSPRQIEEGRRWGVMRQIGLLTVGAGLLAAGLLIAYQAKLLPNGQAQAGLPATSFVTLFILFAAMIVAGGGAVWSATLRLRSRTGAYQLGLFGFEVPLILALFFGISIWFGMRQAVIVSANEVDTPGSVSAFNRAVSLFPELGAAHYLRGERHLASEEWALALVDFDRAAELDANFPATYLARARVLLELGEYEAARADADRLVELRPGHPAGYAVRAWARAFLGDPGYLDDMALATRPLPENARAWDAFFIRCFALLVVDKFDEADRLDEAEADCLRAIELNPGHIVSLDGLAQIAFTRASRASADGDTDLANLQYQAAIDYTSQIILVEEDNSTAWANRGVAYLALDQYLDAERELTQAIELNPTGARAYLDRGIARLYLNRIEDALADVNLGVQIYEDPPSVTAIGDLEAGEVYATRLFVAGYAADHETAIRDADTLEQLEHASPWVLSSRGLSHLALGDVQIGLTDMNRALEIAQERSVDFPQGFDRRGYANLLAGNFAQAEADFDTALEALIQDAQDRAELHYHLALFYQEQGQPERALSNAREAADLAEIPSFAEIVRALQDTLATGN